MAIRTVPPTNGYESAGNTDRRKEQRSFAALYEQARRASGNDNATNTFPPAETEQNRRYIDNLHERVDTLRGELLVRIIQSGRTAPQPVEGSTSEITRLSTRLDSLRKKLQEEEARLSGKLFDTEV
jgi:tetrahydromethanopterin S-methyltransferase subunit G